MRICKKVQYIPVTGNPVFEIFEETEINGRVISLDPRNPTADELQDADEAFAAAQQARIAELESQLAAVTAERDSLATEKTTLTTERDSLQSQVAGLTTSRDGLQTQLTEATTSLDAATGQVEALTTERDSALEQVATLENRIAELTAIAEQPVATLSQIRVWLLQNLGVNAIKQVNAMIEAIPDELQQAIAYQQWEYANNVLRDNPFLLLISQQLGMTTEQMDEAYLAATRIV